jgi:hypothetical protein
VMQGKESSPEVEQELSARDGGFRNFITITDIIISKKPVVLPEILNQKRSAPAEKPIGIAQVQIQYQRHDGKWVECQDANIEMASTKQDDRRKIVTSILNIEPDKLVSVSLYASIRVKGNSSRNSTTRARAHRSLPQPFKLKIIPRGKRWISYSRPFQDSLDFYCIPWIPIVFPGFPLYSRDSRRIPGIFPGFSGIRNPKNPPFPRKYTRCRLH